MAHRSRLLCVATRCTRCRQVPSPSTGKANNVAWSGPTPCTQGTDSGGITCHRMQMALTTASNLIQSHCCLAPSDRPGTRGRRKPRLRCGGGGGSKVISSVAVAQQACTYGAAPGEASGPGGRAHNASSPPTHAAAPRPCQPAAHSTTPAAALPCIALHAPSPPAPPAGRRLPANSSCRWAPMPGTGAARGKGGGRSAAPLAARACMQHEP